MMPKKKKGEEQTDEGWGGKGGVPGKGTVTTIPKKKNGK